MCSDRDNFQGGGGASKQHGLFSLLGFTPFFYLISVRAFLVIFLGRRELPGGMYVFLV